MKTPAEIYDLSASIRSGAAELSNECDVLRRNVASTRDVNLRLINTNSALTAANAELMKERDAALTELSDSRTKHAVEVHGLRDKIDSLTFHRDIVRRERDTAQEKFESLKTVNAKLRRELDEMRNGIHFSSTNELLDDNRALTAANAELMKERDQLKEALLAENRSCVAYLKETKALREQLAASDRAAREQYDALDSRCQIAYSKLLKERDELRAACDDWRQEIRDRVKPSTTLRVRCLKNEIIEVTGSDLKIEVVGERA